MFDSPGSNAGKSVILGFHDDATCALIYSEALSLDERADLALANVGKCPCKCHGAQVGNPSRPAAESGQRTDAQFDSGALRTVGVNA